MGVTAGFPLPIEPESGRMSKVSRTLVPIKSSLGRYKSPRHNAESITGLQGTSISPQMKTVYPKKEVVSVK